MATTKNTIETLKKEVRNIFYEAKEKRGKYQLLREAVDMLLPLVFENAKKIILENAEKKEIVGFSMNDCTPFNFKNVMPEKYWPAMENPDFLNMVFENLVTVLRSQFTIVSNSMKDGGPNNRGIVEVGGWS